MGGPPAGERGWAAALLTGAVNVVCGLIFGWVAIGSSTAAGLLWPCMYEQHNDWADAALLAAINVGCMAGAVSGDSLYVRLGPKRGIAVGALASLAPTVWTMFAYSYSQQMVARIGTGVGIGMLSSLAPRYVMEMSQVYFESDDAPTGTIGGKLGMLFQSSITLGILLVNVAGYFLLGPHRDDDEVGSGVGAAYVKGYCDEYPHLQWYRDRNAWLFLPGAVLCVAAFLLAFAIEESPLWRHAEQHKILLPQEEDCSDSETTEEEPTPFRTWVLGCMGCVALTGCGINAVMFYSGKFFDAANYKHRVLGSVLVMSWNFVMTLVSLSLVHRLGRRGLMITGLFLMAVSVTLLTPMDVWVTNDTVKAVLCFVCLAVYLLGFELGPGCLFWVIIPEIAPPGSSLFPFVNGLQWTLSLVITLAFTPLQDAVGGYVFWFLAAPAWVCLAFFARCLPETGGADPAAAQRAAKRLLRNDPPQSWNVAAANKLRVTGTLPPLVAAAHWEGGGSTGRSYVVAAGWEEGS